MTKYKISVVMPSLNEEANLDEAVRNVIDGYNIFGINGQIVIVNDGSKDNTGKIATALSQEYPFIKVLHHENPQGIGASFWDGVWNSDGEIVAMIPGDGENDATETLRYLPLMDHVDIVIPFVYNKAVRSWKRRLLSVLYRGIINMSFGMSLNYMNGTVMYRKSILKDIVLNGKGFFYQTELLIKTIRKGYLFAEVPYALSQRGGGASKATGLKSLKKVMKAYLAALADVYLLKNSSTDISPDSVTAGRWKEIK
jgi:glycosyltransferase involved in cell wall biosynthesis